MIEFFIWLFKYIFYKKPDEKKVNNIVNLVKYNSPIFFSENIDSKLLEKIGLNNKLPVYKIEKKVTNLELNELSEAQEKERFNVIFILKDFKGFDRFKKNVYRKLEFVKVLRQEDVSMEILTLINKLNINSNKNYSFLISNEKSGLYINGEEGETHLEDYYFKTDFQFTYFNAEIKEFINQNRYYFIRLENLSDELQKIELDFKEILKPNYYYFEDNNRYVYYKNINTNSTNYYNATFKPTKVDYSCIPDMERSTFSKVDINYSFKLKPFEVLYLAISQSKIKEKLSIIDVEKKFIEAKKLNSIFDFKVYTNDQKLNQRINEYLPKRIKLGLLNGQISSEFEEYINFRRQLFTKSDDGINVECNGVFKDKNLSFEVLVEDEFKRINIQKGDKEKLIIDDVEFFNVRFLSYNILKKSLSRTLVI